SRAQTIREDLLLPVLEAVPRPAARAASGNDLFALPVLVAPVETNGHNGHNGHLHANGHGGNGHNGAQELAAREALALPVVH
ncbi:MAG: hypothetical protein C4290_14635, partial [Chloroflexota bacterium]